MIGLFFLQAFRVLGLAFRPFLGLACLGCPRRLLLGRRRSACRRRLGLARPQFRLALRHFRRRLGVTHAQLFLLDLTLDGLAFVLNAPGGLVRFDIVAMGVVPAAIHQKLFVARGRLLFQLLLGSRPALGTLLLQFGGPRQSLLPVGLLCSRRATVGNGETREQPDTEQTADTQHFSRRTATGRQGGA